MLAGKAGVALALAGLGCSTAAMPPSIAHPLAGEPAPVFEGTSTTSAELAVPGSTKVTVVDFWASWCTACRVTMPALERLFLDRGRDGVAVIGVSVDASAEDALATSHRLGATFPLVSDPDQSLAGRYVVGRLPLTFVIDRAGVVRWVGRDPAQAKQAVEAVLAE